jgi:hypothetical protein
MLTSLVLALFLQDGGKKFIEFGWDEPDAAFMRRHAEQMEASPFDGCVFHLNNFTWEVWGTKKFTKEELQPQLDDLKAAPFRRFTSNFLRFNTTPAKIDWFDDYSAVIVNARLAAEIAREGKCKGILLDSEAYDGQLFDYRRQKDAKTKTWEAYAAQARERGREIMKAFQEGYPGVTVLATFAHSLPFWETTKDGKKKPLAEVDYGLLAPFMDGMVDACAGGARIVDGYELAYGFKKEAEFADAKAEIREKVLPIVADPKKYVEVVSAGFGVWMDRDRHKKPWDVNDFSKNYFTPEALEASLRAAFKTADEYVWLYCETPRWWTKEGKTIDLPAPYDEAVRRARK